MKNALLLLLLLVATLSPGLAHPTRPNIEIEELSWMSGHWSDGETEEFWSIPGGSTLHGYNRQIRDTKTTFFENLTVIKTPHNITYWASPLGKNRTPFKMIKSGIHSATFSNLKHDFPQTIIYRRVNDVLLVEISGRGHETIQWRWNRVP